MGPLAVSQSNPRYFTTPGQQPVYLTGSHCNNNLQDGMGPGLEPPDTPEQMDYPAYLAFLTAHGHNFIRLWRWEHCKSQLAMINSHFYMSPQPWPRTGPGIATDGKPRFDLSVFDPMYFNRLRQRVMAAGKQGIYVSVMLFDGFGLHLCKAHDNIQGHPFYGANNVNGIGIASINDYQVLPLKPDIKQLQQAYIQKVVDTVHDLPNVLYEVANESTGGGAASPKLVKSLELADTSKGAPLPVWGDSTNWQYWVIDCVKDYEARQGYQIHPIGMTMQYPVPDPRKANEPLFKSQADWISPGGGASPWDDPTFSVLWLEDPPANDGRKVIISDTDHYGPGKGDALWAWKSFLRGHNPILYDPGVIEGKTPPKPSPGAPPYAALDPARYAMGDTRRYAEHIDLARMQPRGDLSSTKYMLANPGHEYLVLQPSKIASSFTVRLKPGIYSAQWYSVTTRKTKQASPVVAKQGQLTHLSIPFTPTGPAVLHLLKAVPDASSNT